MGRRKCLSLFVGTAMGDAYRAAPYVYYLLNIE